MDPRLLPIAVTLLVGASGCIGSPGTPAAAPDATPAASSAVGTVGDSVSQNASDHPPPWSVGRWWSYRFEFPQQEESFETKIVVHAEDADHWYVSTPEHALNLLAEFLHYPTLGAIRKSDLHPTIHGADIPLFEWPLKDGQTWALPYRGNPATWTVAATEVDTPRGRLGALEVSMAAQSGEQLRYAYAPEAGWFARLEFSFGGPIAFTLSLVDWGDPYAGTVSVFSFTEHLHRLFPVVDVSATPPAAPEALPHELFKVGDGALAWSMVWGGAPGTYGAYAAPLASPQSAGPTLLDQPTGTSVRSEWGEMADPLAGDWGILAGGEANGPGFLFAEILEFQETLLKFGNS